MPGLDYALAGAIYSIPHAARAVPVDSSSFSFVENR